MRSSDGAQPLSNSCFWLRLPLTFHALVGIHHPLYAILHWNLTRSAPYHPGLLRGTCPIYCFSGQAFPIVASLFSMGLFLFDVTSVLTVSRAGQIPVLVLHMEERGHRGWGEVRVVGTTPQSWKQNQSLWTRPGCHTGLGEGNLGSSSRREPQVRCTFPVCSPGGPGQHLLLAERTLAH